MKPTLLILAAGMASRYGSMKQTEGFGPHEETIMDYSIYDAIRAGFGKVVFIIREDFAENFKANFDQKLKGKVEVAYVNQALESHVPDGQLPANREKPWGTGHAVLCAHEEIKEPFAVINADDFYGQDAFVKAADFLINKCDEHTYAIIGYKLNNTLSEHGSVSRGVCEVDGNNNLVTITERTKISKNAAGEIMFEDATEKIMLPSDATVSMNFWGFHQNVFNLSKDLFTKFVAEQQENLKAEYFIPIIADEFIKEEGKTINVIPTSAQWFGVTYKEDAPAVKASLDKLLAANIYPDNLWDV